MSQKYRFFRDEELACKHCMEKGLWKSGDECPMDEAFMDLIIQLRETLNFPFVVSSAYRCKDHPIEARKSTPGAHSSGRAIDIRVNGVRAMKLLREALAVGMLGVGVQQKGDHRSRFIHLDMDSSLPRPAIWSY